MTSQVSRRMDSLEDIEAMMTRLRQNIPAALSGFPITAEDLLERRGQQRTDAVVLSARSAGRPSVWYSGRREPNQKSSATSRSANP